MDNIWQDLHYQSSIDKADAFVLRGIRILTIDMKDDFDIKVEYMTHKGEFKSVHLSKIRLHKIIID